MGKLNAGEWRTYRKLYEQLLALVRPPDLVVYLRRSVAGLAENIRLRGRDYEREIPLDYLARLNRFYEEWIASRPGERILVVEADRLDFLNSGPDLDLLSSQIKSACGQGELFAEGAAPPDARFRLLNPPWSGA